MSLTFEGNTTEDVWQSLGAVRLIFGRQRIKTLTEACVRSWPHELFARCGTQDELDLVASEYAEQIAEQQYGSLLSMLFVGVVSAVVQVLLKWWIDRKFRMLFAAWTIWLKSREASS